MRESTSEKKVRISNIFKAKKFQASLSSVKSTYKNVVRKAGHQGETRQQLFSKILYQTPFFPLFSSFNSLWPSTASNCWVQPSAIHLLQVILYSWERKSAPTSLISCFPGLPEISDIGKFLPPFVASCLRTLSSLYDSEHYEELERKLYDQHCPLSPLSCVTVFSDGVRLLVWYHPSN